MKNVFDIKLIKFIFVGIFNTVFSAIIMFSLYNLGRFDYWSASAIAYILGGIFSFVLNKNYTFKNKAPILKACFKFSLNIIICYLIAYGLAKPLIGLILNKTNVLIIEQISMFFGMILFTGLNYIGQRFYVFKRIDQ